MYACRDISEDTIVADSLTQHFQLEIGRARQHHLLRRYIDVPLAEVIVLMRRARMPANAVQWFALDTAQSWKRQLAGKVIVEFPEVVVVLRSDCKQYNIVLDEGSRHLNGKG